MYRITQGTTHGLSDVPAFIEFLNAFNERSLSGVTTLFDHNAELIVTRAPGRLDVMGGIADYSGSLVLEKPLREATFVALQRRSDRRLRIVSIPPASRNELILEMSLDDLVNAGKPVSYGDALEYFQREPSRQWGAYVAGAFLVLMRERHINFPAGASILIASQVPEGKGVSSSAALEVAVMQAIVEAFAIEIEPLEIALLCQKVENLIAGAPCGIMDQITSVLGEADRLLALLCQPAEIRGSIEVPDQIRFWGLDSGVRHSVAGADYASVRTGAFMGYRMIAELAGLNIRSGSTEELCEIDDPRWGGYLANLSPLEFKAYEKNLPINITGAEFISRYKGTTDPVTRLEPEKTYAVRVPTGHAVHEHQRVRAFADLLAESTSERLLRHLGELMYQSHNSYTACGLNSNGTDLLVQLVREAGPEQGLYGAKITGGGSGGTVAVLGHRDAGPAVEAVGMSYASKTGFQPHIFAGSSPGSAAIGYLKVEYI